MHRTRSSVFAIALSAGASLAGCSGSSNVSQVAAGGTGAVASSSASSAGSGAISAMSGAGSIAQGGAVVLNVPDDVAGALAVGGSEGEAYPDTLPVGFTPANVFGGYRVGDAISADAESPTADPDSKLDDCGTTILAVIRDFKPDRQNFEGPDIGDDRGLVSPQLGADRKPVLASSSPTKTIKAPAQFSDWYRTVDGVNKAYKLQLWFAPNAGVSSFQSTEFFPLDGKGWDAGATTFRNYHFTTEIHTRFKYKGGESFKFTGDDDVWVFINDKLAIDLGGVHGAENASIDIDARATELGLEKGKVYAFDMFQNERHTAESNFRADTNLNFVDCGTIVPEIPK